MKPPSRIRLFGCPNPGGIWDVALDEAILRITREAHGPLTVRVWQGTSPVLVLPQSPLPEETTLIQSCSSKGVHVTRGLSGRRLLLCGPGILNFSFVDESNALSSESLEEKDDELISLLLSGLQPELPAVEMGFDQGYLSAGDSAVGAYNTFYYFEYLLLQGMVLVHGSRYLSNPMISTELRNFISLDHIQSGVSVPRLQEAFTRAILTHLGPQAFAEDAGAQETELMNRLYRWKYTSDEWVLHQSAPLALGRVLLEAYLAYPPTTRCRQIIAVMDDISKAYAEKAECRIWLRGRGLMSWPGGSPPGLRPSGGVVQASKKNIVPAIVVDGLITHERTVPDYDDLCSRIEETYQQKFCGARA